MRRLESAKDVPWALNEWIVARRAGATTGAGTKGLTQADVAARLGVTQQTVAGFESGKHDPRMSMLQRYARAVGARLVLVFAEAEAEPEPEGGKP